MANLEELQQIVLNNVVEIVEDDLLTPRTVLHPFRDSKFVHKDSRLSEDQKKFYNENGYMIIRNNVRHDVIDKFYKRFIDICENRVDDFQSFLANDPVLKRSGAKGENVINKLQDFIRDPVLSEYCFINDIVDNVENIIGSNISAFHTMLINKPPNSHPDISTHPVHQDLYYFPLRPADKIVATWTAMETIHKQNGCLYVVPGSHKEGMLYPHTYPKGLNHAMYHTVQGMDNLPKHYAIMEKGDTIFFHPLLLHGSGPNLSKHFRKAISCHFADSNCHFIDVTNTIQENIKNEVESLYQPRDGARMNFIQLWKIRSRLIRGPPGNIQLLESHL